MNFNGQELVKLPLDEILLNNGYFIKKNKSSRRYIVLSNENEDTVVISKQPNGHFLYFNPNDDGDRGNIFNFCKNRGIKTGDILENKIIAPTSNTLRGCDFAQTGITAIKEFDKMENIGEKNLLSDKRLIASQIVFKFENIKQDKYGNVNVPSFVLKQMQNGEKKREIITKGGYVSYLNNPILKDKDGKAYNKPIKQLCHGAKGLEIIKSRECSDFKAVKNIVICESIIDALSLMEIKGFSSSDTLVCSTNGQICASQKEIFEYFGKKTSANVFLSFDNDEKGNNFSRLVAEILPEAKIVKPVLKDFNDDLTVAKLLNLKIGFSKKDLARTVLGLEKSSRALVNKFELYYPSERQKLAERFLVVDKPVFERLYPKLLGFVNVDNLAKNYVALDKKIAQGLHKSL